MISRGISDRYEISFRDAEGRVRRILRRDVPPREIDEAMRAEYVAASIDEEVQRTGDEGRARARQRFEEATFAETLPVFSRAFVDADQRLWVAEFPWPSESAPPSEWSVFSPDGAWLGDVSAPPGARLLHARGDAVLAVWRDASDVQYVQVHRLVTP